MPRKKNQFVLHSKKNRVRYPASRYPLTHCVDRQTVARRCLRQPTFLGRAIGLFLAFLGLTLFVCVFFRTHVYLYNQLFGPFHVDRQALAIHVKNYDQHPWWSCRKEYFHVELGEGNIQNPSSTYETIRRYSNPRTRQNHVATFKRVNRPWIYVKLPTRSVKSFHRRFPFDFRLFTIATLRCIVQQFDSHLDESDYVPFIEAEYSRNTTRFNSLVLSKCGILVGHLYRPVYESAFLPAREHHFYSSDMALDVTSAYASIISLLVQSFLALALFLSSIYHLFVYLSVLIRVRLLHPRGIFSFPLEFSADLVEELWLLNSNDPVEIQLFHLDRYLQQSEHRFLNQMFVIQNVSQHSFVLFLRANLNEIAHIWHIDDPPFLICPVTDIRRILHDQGICYGPDSSWIPWPAEFANSPQNYSEWLHETLIQTAAHYRRQYENRLRGSHSPDPPGPWNINPALRRRHCRLPSGQSLGGDVVSRLILEEHNFQRLRMERQGLLERFLEPASPASATFIARFRQDQLISGPTRCDAAMAGEAIECTVCFDPLKFGQPYATWPCPSRPPHRFHSNCMLKLLRMKNTCPLCRHPVEAEFLPMPHPYLPAFFSRYV